MPQLSSKTKVSISILYQCVQLSTNQEHLCNQGCHYEKYKFHYAKEAIICNHQINTFHCQQRWMEHKVVSPWRIHFTYCSMPKGTSQAGVTISCYWVVVDWRHQSGSQSVRRTFHLIFFLKIPLQHFESISGRSESLFGLSFT